MTTVAGRSIHIPTGWLRVGPMRAFSSILRLVRLFLAESQTANACDDRQRMNRARQNAEDLFKPRQQTIRAEVPTSAPDAATSAEPQPRRQPRIFTIQPQMRTSAAMVPPTEPKPKRRSAIVGRETREIPASQI